LHRGKDMNKDRILLDHGGGGKLSQHLVADLMLPAFDNPLLAALDDGAVFSIDQNRFAFSTDSYVVDPIFFPGGNIGDLAVNGTVNDLSMCGAKPLYLSCAMIVEEGFEIEELKKIVDTMSQAAETAGVQVVTGDTKVVPKGAADKIFINTSGIGLIAPGVNVSGTGAVLGDKIIISGSIADHGMAVMIEREKLAFESAIKSDSMALNHMVQKMLAASPNIHVLRDPTRGGVATTLNEIAAASKVGMTLLEASIFVRPEVAGACELLGFDPLYVANEGKLLAVVADKDAEVVLGTMHQCPAGREATIIGEVTEADSGRVVMQTKIGGTRIVDMMTGEQLPRIC
jgi:hydrogenase expression/formation protein HypE